jgi:hypothetical protein
MDGMSYLSEVKTKAEANLLMEMKEKSSKFTLKENNFELNNFKMSLDGFYEMLADHDNMDLKMNTNQIAFKDVLSLVPTFYQSGYESMVAKGDVKVDGMVKGRLDDKNLPAWDFGLLVKKASIKYAGVPGTINNINVDAGSEYVGGENLDKMTLDVKKFHADFVGNVIDASLKMRNPMTDPLLDSKVLAKVNLATLGKVMPLAEGESYKGKLNADVALNGRMSAIENENYEAFNATGIGVFSFQLGARNRINHFLSYEAGLSFDKYGEAYKYNATEDDSTFSYTNKYSFVSLPIQVFYTYGKDLRFFIGNALDVFHS